MQKRPRVVAVIGSKEATGEEARLAEEVGRELAAHRVVLVCGGLGGVMEAACRGARSAGGLTIGILPGTSPDDANPHVTIAIASGVGYARNQAVVRSACAVIAVGGGYGTLTEIGYALDAGIPVVGLGTWQVSHRGRPDPPIIPATTAAEAVGRALELAGP